MKGLAFRKTSDSIAAFVREHGSAAPRRAVFCTYDFDPVRFEAVLLPELTRRGRWFRTLVLADGAAIQKDGVLGQRGAASRYELASVRVRGSGVFHPKLIMLQAGARMLVGVGSGNLTSGGLGGNLELMLFAMNDSADGSALAASSKRFLLDLRHSRRVIMPRSADRFLERLCQSGAATSRGPLLHNLDVPLLEQLAAERRRRSGLVAIISPWHSTSSITDGVEPAVLSAVGRAFGAHPIVYTQGDKGKGPRLGSGTEVQILRPEVLEGEEALYSNSDRPNDERPRRLSRLHAKAYLVADKTNPMLWIGSANCTTPALLQSVGKGNVELLVRVALDRKSLARLYSDLGTMFERPSAFLPPGRTPRIPSPRGNVLAGYVSNWRNHPRLVIELAVPSISGRLRISNNGRRGGIIDVSVPKKKERASVPAELTSRLLRGGEAPPMLWEHVGAKAIPFPVSVPCALVAGGPEEMLQDALDDLAGRVPTAFRTRGPLNRDEDDDGSEDTEERDHELELLTASEHEGALDRIAVRVELLRRRIAAMRSNAEREHYIGVIESLAVDPALRRVLVSHLGRKGTDR